MASKLRYRITLNGFPPVLQVAIDAAFPADKRGTVSNARVLDILRACKGHKGEVQVFDARTGKLSTVARFHGPAVEPPKKARNHGVLLRPRDSAEDRAVWAAAWRAPAIRFPGEDESAFEAPRMECLQGGS